MTTRKIPVVIRFKDVPEVPFRLNFTAKASIISSYGGDIIANHEFINSVTAYVPENLINELRKYPDIKYIELEQEAHILGHNEKRISN